MKHKTGTTKKDFVIVLSCVVLLLANLGAVGSGGRRRAKEVVCLSNLLKWGIVWKSFVDDNNGYFISRSWAAAWVQILKDRYPDSVNLRLVLCPEATKTFEEGALNPHMAWGTTMDILGESVYVKGSYGINLWTSKAFHDDSYWRSPYVAGAAYVPMLLDGQWRDMEPLPTDDPAAHEEDLWTPHEHEMRRACISRHNGGVNVVFLDGSVRKVGLKHLWRLKWHRNWPEDYTLPAWPEWMANFKDP